MTVWPEDLLEWNGGFGRRYHDFSLLREFAKSNHFADFVRAKRLIFMANREKYLIELMLGNKRFHFPPVDYILLCF